MKDDSELKIIFKICNSALGTINNEYLIYRTIEYKLAKILPHFVRCYFKQNMKVVDYNDFKNSLCETRIQEERAVFRNKILTIVSSAVSKKLFKKLYVYNPFNVKNINSVERTVLFIENVKGVSMYDFIDNYSIDADKYGGNADKYGGNADKYGAVESIVQQLIYSLFISQQICNFSHRDLHLDNILISDCNDRQFFLYSTVYLGFEQLRLVKSFGCLVRIIDYGHAYTNKTDENPILTSIFFNNGFFIPIYKDNLSDFKYLYLQLRKLKYFSENYNLKLPNIFRKEINMESDTGYIRRSKYSIGTHILEELKKSDLFSTKLFSSKCRLDVLDAFLLLINAGEIKCKPIKSNDIKEYKNNPVDYILNTSKSPRFNNYVELFNEMFNVWDRIEGYISNEDHLLDFWVKLLKGLRELVMRKSIDCNYIIKYVNLLLIKFNSTYRENRINFSSLIRCIFKIVDNLKKDIQLDIECIMKIEKVIYESFGMYSQIDAINIFERALNLNPFEMKYDFLVGDSINLFDSTCDTTRNIIINSEQTNILNSVKNCKEQAAYIKQILLSR